MSETATVAALYVETGGAYYGLDGVDPWDEKRDARLYAGPWPVVAHPPCARWCQLAPLVASKLRYLGDKYAIGNDGGCFEAALNAVRTYGGVLEHPAYSLAWYRYSLPVPGHGGWTSAIDDPGWSTAVSQVAYGHLARKRTWLYYVGPEPPALRWSEPPAQAQVSAFTHKKKGRPIKLDKGLSNPTPAMPARCRSCVCVREGGNAVRRGVPPKPTMAQLARSLGMTEVQLRERGEAYRRYALGLPKRKP